MAVKNFDDITEMYLLRNDKTTFNLSRLAEAVEELKGIVFQQLSRNERSKLYLRTVHVDIKAIELRHGLDGEIAFWLEGIANLYLKEIHELIRQGMGATRLDHLITLAKEVHS